MLVRLSISNLNHHDLNETEIIRVSRFTCEVSPFTKPIDSGGLSLGLQIDKTNLDTY